MVLAVASSMVPALCSIQALLVCVQVKAVLVCADLYFSHMARLQQERTLIKAQLKQSDVAKEDLLIDTGG